MAKGIGNGFPLAAVVTTPGTKKYSSKLSVNVELGQRNFEMCKIHLVWSFDTNAYSLTQLSFSLPYTEIAASMTKSLHFNTFGGNPMASAVGSTVLDVSAIHISSPVPTVHAGSTASQCYFL